MKTDHYDQIIIGRGLAGTLLSVELIRRGQKVLVIDNKNEGSSTKIAAGMYNPMVFKRLVKAWMADELLPVAKETYEEISSGSWQTKGLIKLFTTEKDPVDWVVRSQESGYEDHLLMESDEGIDRSDLIRPFGYGLVPNAGRIDFPALLEAGKEFLKGQEAILETEVQHDSISFSKGSVRIDDKIADNIIFCEGNQVSKNPWFNFLPFKLAKGEVLTLRMPELDIERMVNRGHFILPLGDGTYKVGATWEWKELDNEPTEKGKEWILERLRRAYKGPVEIVDHTAGIRPATADRRPIIGRHPEQERAWIFNGLGSRGGMNAPYFAKHFIGHFLDGEELIPEIDIQRFC